MGERRWRAAQAVGRETHSGDRPGHPDDAMLRDALLENIHRANLNPLEEAAAYQQLLEEFGATHEELARRIGRSRPQISNTIRLLNLPAQVQRRVAAGVLSAGHARALLEPRRRRGAGAAGACGSWPRGSRCGRPRRLVALALADGAGEDRGGQAATQAARAGADRPGRPAVGPVRHPGEGRHRPEQGEDHDRVRDGRRPGADRGHHRRRAGGAARGVISPPRPRPRGPASGPRGRSLFADHGSTASDQGPTAPERHRAHPAFGGPGRLVRLVIRP